MNKKKRLLITLPVYNEENDLSRNLPFLYSFLEQNLYIYDWKIIIAEQASTDTTLAIAQEFSKKYPRVNYVHRVQKGRGGALRHVWESEDADYYGYTDIDMSSQLKYLVNLCTALDHGHHIAIGSRLNDESKVIGRSMTREILSRTYNILIRIMFRTHFVDAQCGFKLITKEAVKKIIPHTKNSNWFFDSELLILAEKSGFRIKVVPIEWKDDPQSSVRIVSYIFEDIKGLICLYIGRPWKNISKPSLTI